jgi:hypothetical protein
MQKPVIVDTRRAAGLRFADPRVQALLHVLLLFLLVQGTFRHSDLRGLPDHRQRTADRPFLHAAL